MTNINTLDIQDADLKWKGRRYYPISQYFVERFGTRVGKVSVSIAETCPNRSETNDDRVCVFCDEWGSAAYPLEREKSLSEQIQHNIKHVRRRLKTDKFLVYFQSYTNTLDKVALLKDRFDIALAEEHIAGIVIGTRPDCLPQRLLPLLDQVSKEHYAMVELGAQSLFDDQLEFLRRGHTAECTREAVAKLHEHTDSDVCLHLMFGLPNETDAHIIETAQQVNDFNVSNVKLHNLHVLKNTPLEELYRAGKFVPVELEEYAEKVSLFLRHLSPHIAVQRLAALSSRWDELIAPQWTRQKMPPLEFIENKLRSREQYQGDLFPSKQIQLQTSPEL
ncbi:MAG: TIGR01212 family radical SAM protein [Pseudomonadales bacterium]|nr:TIGR01212 family radical SAM protein [Pseudomonadales bacterium]